MFSKPSLSGSSKVKIVWYLNLNERYRFPPQQKMLLTTVILSFLYNFIKKKKTFPFLDRQNSGLFDTQTYARVIDFLLSKKKL